LRVSALRVGELDEPLLARWEGLRRACPWAASPFFSPQYARAVAAARPRSRVAIVEDAGAAVAFFPFEPRGRRALPIGPGVTDHQGAVSEPDAPWSVPGLLRGLGLTAYAFDHVPTADPRFAPYARRRAASPVLDLAGGFDAYVESCRGTERDGPSEALRKRRRLGRAAEVRFEPDDASPDALESLLGWKTEQHGRTGSLPVFEIPWVRGLLERLRTTRGPDVSGMLSSLYADDELIAANFGLRSGPLLHSWVFGFDPAWRKHSPGSVLVIALAESLPGLGIHVYDFGKGSEPYKQRFATTSVELGEGSVTLGAVPRAREWLETKAVHAAFRTPLGGAVGRLRQRRLFAG
jgi:CelD/BcsL family acetyltransferase involved in cellulose biosynthesis